MENRPHPPLCDQCEGDHELTVQHILIECNFLKIIRQRHYDVTDLNQLFKTVSSKRILDFVKDIGLYNTVKCRYKAVFGVQEIDRAIAVTAL